MNSGGNSFGSASLRKVTFASAVEDGPGRPGEALHGRGRVRAELAEPPADLRQLPQVADAGRERVRRRLVEQRLDELGDAEQHRLVLRQRLRVPRGELTHLVVG